jgi:hypothetical protein
MAIFATVVIPFSSLPLAWHPWTFSLPVCHDQLQRGRVDFANAGRRPAAQRLPRENQAVATPIPSLKAVATTAPVSKRRHQWRQPRWQDHDSWLRGPELLQKLRQLRENLRPRWPRHVAQQRKKLKRETRRIFNQNPRRGSQRTAVLQSRKTFNGERAGYGIFTESAIVQRRVAVATARAAWSQRAQNSHLPFGAGKREWSRTTARTFLLATAITAGNVASTAFADSFATLASSLPTLAISLVTFHRAR